MVEQRQNTNKVIEQMGAILTFVPDGIRVRVSRSYRERMLAQAAQKIVETGKASFRDRAVLFFAAPEEHNRIGNRLQKAKQVFDYNRPSY